MKLWHKYAIALFLVALVPLVIAAWQIAGRGADEVTLSAKAYHVAIGDSGLATVRGYLDSAQAEAKTLGATIAMPGVAADERMRAAQAQLIGAKVLETFVVFTPEGADVEHMTAADKDKRAVAAIEPPVPLLAELRDKAKADGVAWGTIVKGPDGSRYLPMVTRIVKPDGSLYAFGWTALPLAPLSAAMGELSQRRFGDPSLVTLIDGSLTVVGAGDPARVGQPFVARGADLGIDDGSALRRDMAHTFEYVTAAGEPRLGALTPVVELGWGIVVEQPKAEVFAAVSRIWTTAALVGGAFALAALLLGIFAARRLSAPISALSTAAGRVAGGDFSVQVPVPGKDEVGQLATSFNRMASQLTDTIAKLQETTAAKERMQTELDIGRNIQMSMVPLNFPAFPDRREFDVHAALKPAYEVGGDFYDFFLIDDHTLCVCIADVSGKGVPAALFMAVTRTMVKAHASAGLSSDEILDHVNDNLAKDNDACMFVTMFLGLVDLKTGEVTFTNAGHNPSYVKRASDGKVVRLEELHGPVVAAMEDVPYASGKVKLERGDTLVLYTDGVNEAMNAKHELFTEERLARLLRNNQWQSADGAVKIVLDDVWKFQGDAQQADDVTVVALRYLGA